MPTPTPPTTPTNSTGGGLVPEFPSGWDLLQSALSGAVESLTSGVASLIDMFHYSLLTLPAVGNPTAPATWATPEDPYWIAVAAVYGMLAGFVFPLVWGVGLFNIGVPRGLDRRTRTIQLVKAAGLIIAGWPLLQFWLHFWNEATLLFAPSGAELLSTPGSTAKLGVGVALGVLLLAYNAVVILVGLLIHLMFILLTFVFVALWPLSIGLYFTDNFALKSAGVSGITGMLLLSLLQFVKGVLLRLIYEFPLNVGEPKTAITFLLIAVGVTLAFVGVPYFGLKRLLPRTIVSAGGRHGRSSRHQERMAGLRDRAPSGSDLRERVADVSSDAKSRLARRDGGSGTDSELRSRSFRGRRNHNRGGDSYQRQVRRGRDEDTRTRSMNDRTNGK